MADFADLRFNSTINIDRSYREKCRQFTRPEFSRAVSAFEKNLDRIVSMSVLFHGLYVGLWVGQHLKNRSLANQPLVLDSDQLREAVDYLVDKRLLADSDAARGGTEAILSAMVVGSWAA